MSLTRLARAMVDMLSTLVRRMDSLTAEATDVIPWSCPVPAFGDLSTSLVATLGLNPSNREFVDEAGNELNGPDRRLHTLRSLGLTRWSEADAGHLERIENSCRRYFSRNPYNEWFRSLDRIIAGTRASYYSMFAGACHLDLVPYATRCKWTDLTTRQRSSLLSLSGDTLGLLLRDSPVRLIVVNGRTVIENLQRVAGVALDRVAMGDWTLPRQAGSGVAGFAYRGPVRRLAGVDLGRLVLVLGFNHNLQSSYGVTSEVKDAIRDWITHAANEVIE
jgi:hypothetical protein